MNPLLYRNTSNDRSPESQQVHSLDKVFFFVVVCLFVVVVFFLCFFFTIYGYNGHLGHVSGLWLQ